MKYKVTVPHAGEYYIAFEYMFRRFGYEVVVPPPSSEDTLNLGVKYAPSQACLPFKVTLGNLIESFDNGTNVVAMIGGRTGVCRLAFYSEMYRKILSDMGYQFDVVHIKVKKQFFEEVKNHCPGLTKMQFFKTLKDTWLKFRLVEIIREQYLEARACEKNKGEALEIRNRIIEALKKAETAKELKRLKKEVKRKFAAIERVDEKEVLKMCLVGEFFMVIDQFTSLHIEEMFADQRVIIVPTLSFTDFFLGSVKQIRFLDKFLPTEAHKINKYAKNYVNRSIGGHARQTIGQTIHYAKKGMDGVVQIYPFACMPDMVANSMLSKISNENNIPILSLRFDEQTGEEGIRTRIEAFVDMVRMRKEKRV